MPSPLELQIQTLPNEPGVYQYFDKDDVIIYIGKAKNLKKRVASYFNKNHENGKTSVLVKKIVYIKHIVVNTETDALLLENNLTAYKYGRQKFLGFNTSLLFSKITKKKYENYGLIWGKRAGDVYKYWSNYRPIISYLCRNGIKLYTVCENRWGN